MSGPKTVSIRGGVSGIKTGLSGRRAAAPVETGLAGRKTGWTGAGAAKTGLKIAKVKVSRTKTVLIFRNFKLNILLVTLSLKGDNSRILNKSRSYKIVPQEYKILSSKSKCGLSGYASMGFSNTFDTVFTS